MLKDTEILKQTLSKLGDPSSALTHSDLLTTMEALVIDEAQWLKQVAERGPYDFSSDDNQYDQFLRVTIIALNSRVNLMHHQANKPY